MTPAISDRLRNLPRRLRAATERRSEPALAASAGLVLVLGTGWSLLAHNTEIEVTVVLSTVVVLSSLVLGLRRVLVLLAAAALCLGLVLRAHGRLSQLSMSGLVTVLVVGLVAVLQAQRRDRLGLKRVSAETVLGLIRDRVSVQARPPALPAGWTVEIQQRPAHGAALSGDLVANRLVTEGTSQLLHLAVLDVAGSGIAAGPRALLLSGAVGGLLGSVPPEQFLVATNDYLSRQQWSVGLASAIYLQLDLGSGEYTIRAAGHPPALHYRPTQARPWRTSQAAGTVLGVLPAVPGVLDRDVLQPGEALCLYTDGVVEDRGRGAEAGTRRLMDGVEALAAGVPAGAGPARLLIDRVPKRTDDDRTLVLIRRQPIPAGDRPSWHAEHWSDRTAVPAGSP